MKTPRLKALELQGYKTFASKTRFEFSPTITAIVGPNGSGKSNIADAIRWVLGEQSYSLLRGKKTEDMIFAGSESRARASMAAATITFDNEDGWLPIDFSEVTVGRRAFRDGQNEYLLNGQKVRLRDTVELLAESGLSERTYTIIGQGLVDAALSLKAEERRRLFEEAAGIELYRARREETVRRLDATRRNLERVQDILAELRPRLRSLERQAQRARDLDHVRSTLHELLHTWYGYHWYRAQDQIAASRAQAGRQEAERERLRRRQEQTDQELNEIRASIDALRVRLHKKTAQTTQLYDRRDRVGRRLAVAEERLRWLQEQERQAETELAVLMHDEERIRRRLREAEAQQERHRQQVVDAPEDAQGEPAAAGSEAVLQLSKLRQAQESLTIEKAALLAAVEQTGSTLELHKTRRAELDEQRQALQREIAEAESALSVTHQSSAEAEAGLNFARRQEEDSRRRLEQLAAERERAEDALENLRRRVAAAQARLTLIQEAQADRVSGRWLIEHAAEQGSIQGLIGRLGEQLETATRYQAAIRAALGAFFDGLLLEAPDDLERALEALERQGRSDDVSLVPILSRLESQRLEVPDDLDVLGVAEDLVVAPRRFRASLRALLGRTLVVRDRSAARRLLPRLPTDVRLVTLRGEVFLSGGAVTVARDQAVEPLPDAQDVERELADLQGAIQGREAEWATIRAAQGHSSQRADRARQSLMESQELLLRRQAERGAAEAQLRTLKASEEDLSAESKRNMREVEDYAQKRDQLKTQLEELDTRHTELVRKLARAKEAAETVDVKVEVVRAALQREAAQEALGDLQLRIEELRQRLASTEQERATWDRRQLEGREERASLEAEVVALRANLTEVEEELAALGQSVEALEGELTAAETQRTRLETDESRGRAELTRAERAHSQAQIDLARREEEIASLRRRIEDDFGLVTFEEDQEDGTQEPLPIAGMVEHLQRVERLEPETESQVHRLRTQLRRMGSVNPEARREYEEVRQRVEFMRAQVDDLRQAESQIQEVIGELDVLMEREFRTTFEAVAAEFRQVFTRLFGGGSARLVLTDPSDLTATGIDIEARLPGRREQGLAMLSGGERSLTASALVFALLRVSPTPFCVMDEVDAMLDEANVIRFCDLLHELSEKTQFILVTHNRQTVQAAEVVYGVSMGSDTVSRVISLRLDEAEKVIAA